MRKRTEVQILLDSENGFEGVDLLDDAEDLRESGEEGREGDGLVGFVEIGGGGETDGESGDVVLDEDGEIGVTGAGVGLDAELVVNLARGGDEGMVEGDAAGLAQGGIGDVAVGGGLGGDFVEDVGDLVADFAGLAGLFGADFEFEAGEFGRAVEGLSGAERSENNGGAGFLRDGDFEDAPDDAVHDDHGVLGGFPLGAGFLMDTADDVGLHHAEAGVVEASEGDPFEDESGVDGALEVVQKEAQAGEVVRVLGLGVGEENDVGLGFDVEAAEEVGEWRPRRRVRRCCQPCRGR